MIKEKFINCDDGIDISQQRHLIEITNTMARALTESEFLAIVRIYDYAITRVLAKEK